MLKLPLNIWILAISFSLAMTGISLLVFIGGIIGAQLAPSASLATLPLALFVIGNALATIPAAMLSKRLGRKPAAYIGFCLSLVSAAVCAYGIERSSFWLYVTGAFILGSGAAFYHQFRFAAIESLSDKNDAGPALSLIMLCSIFGAIGGPEMATLGKDILPTFNDYVGSFVFFGGTIVLAMLSFSFFKEPKATHETHQLDARPFIKVMFQPGFLIALGAAAIGYSLMSFLMTSTPISMHVIEGHALGSAKWVIQSHLAAMFLPSLFSGFLIKRFGPVNIMLAGGLIYLGVIAIALAGQQLMHYWWALVLLGIGWNFLFLSGTSLLPNYYRDSERFKAQAANDFSVFSLQALASLSAAWVLYQFGWQTQVWACLPLIILLLGSAMYLKISLHKNQTQ